MTNLSSRVEFYEKFGPFKAELADLGPAEVVQLRFALVEKKAIVGDTQIEQNTAVVLKCEQMLKNIRVKEESF